MTGFASTYGADLDAAISGAKASLTSLRQRLKLAKAEADRLEKVKASGLSSQSAVDAAHASVAELDHQIADATAALCSAPFSGDSSTRYSTTAVSSARRASIARS